MRGRTGHRRDRVVLAAALAVAGLTALGLGGVGGFGRPALAQPDRGIGPVLPGETVTPMPNQMPGERPDRWLLPADPILRPVIEAEGTLEAIGSQEVLLGTEPDVGVAPGVPTAIGLADDTTFYVEGVPTTFDQVPEGVPARVTYELQGDRRVALRVEALEGAPAPPLPEPAP